MLTMASHANSEAGLLSRELSQAMRRLWSSRIVSSV